MNDVLLSIHVPHFKSGYIKNSLSVKGITVKNIIVNTGLNIRPNLRFNKAHL